MQQTVTGKPNYIRKRVDDMQKSGYKVVRSHQHPNGDQTYVMEMPEGDKSALAGILDRNKKPPQQLKRGGATKKHANW